MDYNLEKLNDIFMSVKNTLIKHSDLSIDEFASEYDKYKQLADMRFSDDDYYWIMVYVVFYSGFKATIVSKRLDVIKGHFPDYKTVMRYGKDMFIRIMNDVSMIKNEKKIKACIENARHFDKVIKQYGNFENYVNSFKPNENDGNLFAFKEDLAHFEGLGKVTTYHFMTDIGLNVIKPDRVLMRIFRRLGLVNGEDDFYKGIEVGRKFAQATNLPIRYIDVIFVIYGQLNVPGITSICTKSKPNCPLCGVRQHCNYSAPQQERIRWWED